VRGREARRGFWAEGEHAGLIEAVGEMDMKRNFPIVVEGA